MTRKGINIILTAILLIISMGSGSAQHGDMERLYGMAQRVDSVSGYQKAKLLLELAEGFENI